MPRLTVKKVAQGNYESGIKYTSIRAIAENGGDEVNFYVSKSGIGVYGYEFRQDGELDSVALLVDEKTARALYSALRKHLSKDKK